MTFLITLTAVLSCFTEESIYFIENRFLLFYNLTSDDITDTKMN